MVCFAWATAGLPGSTPTARPGCATDSTQFKRSLLAFLREVENTADYSSKD